MIIRNAEPRDIPAILSIYNHAVRETTAAWTSREETLDDRLTWYEARMSQGLPVLVAAGAQEEILGFASFGAFRAKEGYRLTAEHTLYVDPTVQRQGIGRKLLLRLMDIAHEHDIHVLVGVVDGDNNASIKLHEGLGFEKTGHLPQVGTKFGRWLDLVFLTKVLKPMEPPKP
ncbi:MAG: GNAT family N-acetyltransferase [Roseibium sp.]|uniref:GNAT family N-acetyltransferase n=1 Tax=Roseibium sp. TaxID=1936156 RepID=UPI002629F8D9|nr:GNAT family N-acetyltransferase [Roseibium sp.]MCV0427495.1 GNAT family N-acetyltransferase [Roseibium sp.]